MQGFPGGAMAVRDFARPFRDPNLPPAVLVLHAKRSIPAPSSLARLLALPDRNSPKQKELVDKLFTALSFLPKCRDLVLSFQDILRRRAEDELEGWLETAKASELPAFVSFVHGIRADYAAVKAAFSFCFPAAGGTSDGRCCGKSGWRHQCFWLVAGSTQLGSAEPAGRITLRYDADTGTFIRADVTRYRGVPAASRQERPPAASPQMVLSTGDAVVHARSWLTKLGLAPAGKTAPLPAVLFPPDSSRMGVWRVWLQGRDTAQGRPLTVEVAVSSAEGSLLWAAVAERCPFPSFFLPRRSSGSRVSRL